MGFFLSKLRDLFSTAPPSRVLLLGLDAAGKTTILYKLKLDETVSTIPTIGFNVETITPTKGLSFIVWDVGGQERIRILWRHYYYGTRGLIFVIDSSDRERIMEAKDELYKILDDDLMRDVPVEIIANKQDLIGTMKPFEIADKLGLHKQHQRMWHVQGACAILGDGLYEAMESLVSMIKKQDSSNSWHKPPS